MDALPGPSNVATSLGIDCQHCVKLSEMVRNGIRSLVASPTGHQNAGVVWVERTYNTVVLQTKTAVLFVSIWSLAPHQAACMGCVSILAPCQRTCHAGIWTLNPCVLMSLCRTCYLFQAPLGCLVADGHAESRNPKPNPTPRLSQEKAETLSCSPRPKSPRPGSRICSAHRGQGPGLLWCTLQRRTFGTEIGRSDFRRISGV